MLYRFWMIGERNRSVDLDQVRRKIAVGLEQLERGEELDGDQVFEELLAGLDERQGVGGAKDIRTVLTGVT
jgi:hypothetical protein